MLCHQNGLKSMEEKLDTFALQATQKLEVMKNIINQKKQGIFELELMIRFGKRQLISSKSQDQTLDLNKKIMQWEAVVKGEKQYIEFLVELMNDELKNLPKS